MLDDGVNRSGGRRVIVDSQRSFTSFLRKKEEMIASVREHRRETGDYGYVMDPADVRSLARAGLRCRQVLDERLRDPETEGSVVYAILGAIGWSRSPTLARIAVDAVGSHPNAFYRAMAIQTVWAGHTARFAEDILTAMSDPHELVRVMGVQAASWLNRNRRFGMAARDRLFTLASDPAQPDELQTRATQSLLLFMDRRAHGMLEQLASGPAGAAQRRASIALEKRGEAARRAGIGVEAWIRQRRQRRLPSLKALDRR